MIMSEVDLVVKEIKCCMCGEVFEYEEPKNPEGKPLSADWLPDGYFVPRFSDCDHKVGQCWICDGCGSCYSCGRSLEKEPEKRGKHVKCRYCEEEN